MTTITNILNAAKSLNAQNFAKFLDNNKISFTILDCNIMDYNDDYFNIIIDKFDENILFFNGEFQS
jgi:hypothetical protein